MKEQGEQYVSLHGNVGKYKHVRQQDAADDCRSDSSFHEHFRTYVLPNEIIEEIANQTLVVDVIMLGMIHRVSKLFRDLTSQSYPHIHMTQSLSEECKLSQTGESQINVRRIVRNAVEAAV